MRMPEISIPSRPAMAIAAGSLTRPMSTSVAWANSGAPPSISMAIVARGVPPFVLSGLSNRDTERVTLRAADPVKNSSFDLVLYGACA